jgi:hypothetical protein
MVQATVIPSVETTHHHGSHRSLIWWADKSAPLKTVDAIFVPTIRPVAYLKEAAAAALSLGCPLVTLHSRKWTNASAAAAYLDPDLDLIAIDVPDPARLRLPELETSQLLAGTIFERRTDLSTKRNLALALSHKLRWNRIVFLDDDIRVPDPRDLSRAAGLLDAHMAVGLGIEGFPDNSVVCHAFRDAGGNQETFIGGGALAVEMRQNRSFFPNIYNDDWFFVLDAGKRLQPVATVGQVLQYPYDPYRVERARAEEFGDVLAEGIFWLLDQGKSASDGDQQHWQDFLVHRKRFIGQVRSMVASWTRIESAERARMDEALTAALGRCERISPELCVEYMEALATDQQRWQRHIRQIWRQPAQSREEALESLTAPGETPLTWHTTKTPAAKEPGAARERRPLDAATPARRSARAGEVPATILSPPSALGTPGFTAAKPASLLPQRPEALPSRASTALVAAQIAFVALACQQHQSHSDGEGRPSPPAHP